MMKQWGIFLIEIIIDFSLLIDIIMSFFTQYEVDGVPEKSLPRIWKWYLLTYFAFDLISVFPAIVTWEKFWFLYYLKLARFVKTPRFFTSLNFVLNKIWNTFPKLIGKQNMNNLIRFIKLILTLLMVIHIFACVYILIGQTHDGWLTNTLDYANEAEKFSRYYITSFYQIVTTFTTVGFGDIVPIRINETVYIMFAQLVGLMIFSNILAAI